MTYQKRTKLATDITRQASKQTYYLFKFFVDRDKKDQAFRAYAYFRWLDDLLDGPFDYDQSSQEQNLSFVQRQRGLLEDLYNGVIPLDLDPPEELLVDLVESDPSKESGLYLYLDRMMRVMEFDAQRRNKEITKNQLDDYVEDLAVSVTEILHYVIGGDQPAPMRENRYHAVTAAHITHMLRDTLDDAQHGYFNIPGKYLREHQITAFDVHAQAYRDWVCNRVIIAREYFRTGRRYLARVPNLRCRIVGFAYASRFEWVLGVIERENYSLRKDYKDRKSFKSGLWMIWNTLRYMGGTLLHKRTYITLPPPGEQATKS
jgi:phytoene/squalene synthetase